jgi:hypothetical protein
MTARVSFVDMLVITRLDEPVSVQVTVIQPSGAESSIVLSAEQMDTLCARWQQERARITIAASPDADKE